ncbi:Pr6Pr family membrane protein [Crenobacter cavernae]|uniref:Pr6Pr family membrane protein n=1 Tax=Crenobacter cavernae TaxID=2290923 RepID=A0ABY0FAG5_9NEIS|nr:Pr6Pr family membrane protein [Crenobacter cavernae]RXZ42576.1 hypothetical protein EBB06_11775 [Crenobacter cavernae]
MKNHQTRRAFEVALLTAGWFALGLQLYHGVAAGLAQGVPWPISVFNFFSYFTILTNLLLAAGLTLPLLFPDRRFSRFLGRPAARSASLTYIAIVGVVYELLLRELWHPTGLQWLADLMLHDAIPLGYFVYWVLYVPPARLRWHDALRWLAYPAAYLGYTLLRGTFLGHYPYPFLNVLHLGYEGVLLNSAFLAMAFFAMGSLVVALDARLKAARTVRSDPPGEGGAR